MVEVVWILAALNGAAIDFPATDDLLAATGTREAAVRATEVAPAALVPRASETSRLDCIILILAVAAQVKHSETVATTKLSNRGSEYGSCRKLLSSPTVQRELTARHRTRGLKTRCAHACRNSAILSSSCSFTLHVALNFGIFWLRNRHLLVQGARQTSTNFWRNFVQFGYNNNNKDALSCRCSNPLIPNDGNQHKRPFATRGRDHFQ